MAALLSTSRAAEGGEHSPGHCGVHLARLWRSSDVPSPLRGGIFGIFVRSRRSASGHPKISVGGRAGLALALACDDSLPLHRRGRVLGRVDGRPVSTGKGNNLVCRSITNHLSKELSYRKWRSDLELADLPEDVLRRIFSKLQYSEVVRTSVLSSKWRHMWIISSRLSLDCTAIRGRRRYFRDKKRYTQQCIDIVNMVLHQFHGEVVEGLEIRVEFHDILVGHLNDWISFALSSLAKNLALDLLLAEFIDEEDMYIFPSELFDSASISRLQHLQLSCVSFKPGSRFMGFPNLKKLDLHLFSASRKNLDIDGAAATATDVVVDAAAAVPVAGVPLPSSSGRVSSPCWPSSSLSWSRFLRALLSPRRAAIKSRGSSVASGRASAAAAAGSIAAACRSLSLAAATAAMAEGRLGALWLLLGAL